MPVFFGPEGRGTAAVEVDGIGQAEDAADEGAFRDAGPVTLPREPSVEDDHIDPVRPTLGVGREAEEGTGMPPVVEGLGGLFLLLGIEDFFSVLHQHRTGGHDFLPSAGGGVVAEGVAGEDVHLVPAALDDDDTVGAEQFPGDGPGEDPAPDPGIADRDESPGIEIVSVDGRLRFRRFGEDADMHGMVRDPFLDEGLAHAHAFPFDDRGLEGAGGIADDADGLDAAEHGDGGVACLAALAEVGNLP